MLLLPCSKISRIQKTLGRLRVKLLGKVVRLIAHARGSKCKKLRRLLKVESMRTRMQIDYKDLNKINLISNESAKN